MAWEWGQRNWRGKDSRLSASPENYSLAPIPLPSRMSVTNWISAWFRLTSSQAVRRRDGLGMGAKGLGGEGFSPFCIARKLFPCPHSSAITDECDKLDIGVVQVDQQPGGSAERWLGDGGEGIGGGRILAFLHRQKTIPLPPFLCHHR